MRSSRRRIGRSNSIRAAFLGAALALFGCTNDRGPGIGADAGPADDCSECHGGPENAAPPKDTNGLEDLSALTVGAHQAHLAASDWHRQVLCEDCHVVPAGEDDPGHIDASPAELTWGAIALADNAVPSFDRASGTCGDVYCHGSTLIPGGTLTEPVWNRVDGTQARCGTCHGLILDPPHPDARACGNCHGMVVDNALRFVDASLHINGVVDVDSSGVTCLGCHGSLTNAAPPTDTRGRSETTEVTVGAHQAHLGVSTWHREILCEDCHLVPEYVDDAGHLGAAPAELTWGEIAQADGATPAFDRDGATCSNNYCHGTTLIAGGSLTEPTWTVVDGTQAACGTCHGLPPAAPHPDSTDCEQCHGMVVDANNQFVDASLHINGVVDVIDTSCGSCHGGALNSAPPVDTQGGNATSLVTVGAHQAHLGTSTWHREIQCSDCHVVPSAVDDVGHLGDAPAELTWSALARSDGATPAFDRAQATCSSTYCHGPTLIPGGTNTQPTWTTVDGTQAACGTCHGLPPAAPHPNATNCEQCHGMVVDASGNFVDPALHIDGVVNVIDTSCGSCHGNELNAAPPVDTQGDSATTSVTVGAHQAHLGTSNWHREVLCDDCHDVPSAVNDPGHLDAAPADLTWSALAQADGAVPSFDRTQATCSDTYCHGPTLIPGGTNTTPVWTTVNANQATCGTCHGLPPEAPHPSGTNCEPCHGMVVDGAGNFVDPSLHINGIVEVVDTSCGSCHGGELNAAPPVDTQGGTATSLVTVGAHQAHLGASDWHREVLCEDCHDVPSAVDDPGHLDAAPADFQWSALASADGAAPSFDRTQATCSSTYCHGATLIPGGSIVEPSWTTVDGSQAACGTCHGMPPAAPHPARSDCEACHGEVHDGVSFVAPSLHIDGIVQLSGDCGSCHGNPPSPETESYVGSGGAHARHVGTLGYACSVCHGHDGSGPQHDEGNGTVLRSNVDIVFDPNITFPGGTTMNNGGSPSHSFGGGNPTCFVGCHNPIPGRRCRPDERGLVDGPAPSAASAVTNDPDFRRQPTTTSVDPTPRSAQTARSATTCRLHLSGNKSFADPDPTDAHSYAAQGIDGLCRTCHDGGPGTFFGGESPDDMSAFWTIGSHGLAGHDCSTCHGYHGSTLSTNLVATNEETLCNQCHDGGAASTDIESLFLRTSRHPVLDAEQTAFQLECVSCHDPHLRLADHAVHSGSGSE